MRSRMLGSLLTSIADAGRDLVRPRGQQRRRGIETLCRELLSTRGEASGVALARELIDLYRALSEAERDAFFTMLGRDYGPDPDAIQAAVEAYRAQPGFQTRLALRRAAEPPRQELIRRMNMAPGGTRAILRLRTELLSRLEARSELREVDEDLHHLLSSWFNPGFLTLTRIDWDSPASLLERLVRYERVHKMSRLEDIRRRLGPDRRCYAFFHPALPDEPLIFVQVALVGGIADKVQPLIDPDAPQGDGADADTAIFYSISNCQEGLRGVTLGNFLIKLVVASIAADLPQIRTYATLSPVPGFSAWLRSSRQNGGSGVPGPFEREALELVERPGWHADPASVERLRPLLTSLCAHYLVRVKEPRGSRPQDAVARFHLGNGARLERINFLGDISAKGMAESFGMLVNYRYDPASIEKNHEAYANQGAVVHAPAVRSVLPKVAEPAPAA